jgi:hypothetical protein
MIALLRPATLAWATAFATVFSLYAHTFFGLDADQITPILAQWIAAILLITSLLWVARPYLWVPSTLLRGLSGFIFLSSILVFVASGLFGFVNREINIKDWGLFFLQVGTPILLFFSNVRPTLLRATAVCCVLFATLDAGANIGAAAGLWSLSDAGARYGELGQRISRFGGLSGSSLATGLVALVAVGFLASRLRQPRQWVGFMTALTLLLLIGVSLELSDARRYLGGAVVMVALLALPWGSWVPLPLVSATLGFGGLFLTFDASDSENVQRANLMASGWRDALSNIWMGEGVYYRQTAATPDFNGLWASHATESGAIDLAIAYGWLATAALIISALLALGAKRDSLTWPPVLLSIMTGEIAYTNPISGFLGAVLFFGCIIFIVCDEHQQQAPNGFPTSLSGRRRS